MVIVLYLLGNSMTYEFGRATVDQEHPETIQK